MEEEFQNRSAHLSSHVTNVTVITPDILRNLNLTPTFPLQTIN